MDLLATAWDEGGRVAQKRRTRSALVRAAAQLLASGMTPTIASAAEVADVSRATAYRYFPSQESLLLEATLEMALPRVGELFDLRVGDDPVERIDIATQRFQVAVAENETPARAMQRIALDPRPALETSDADRVQEMRAGRRIGIVEEALAPVRRQLPAGAFRRLVDALCMVVGIDGFVVARDLRGRSANQAVEVSRWAARALVRAALEEARQSAPERAGHPSGRSNART